jgi:membrane protein YdbS with pleckstrin-like domain
MHETTGGFSTIERLVLSVLRVPPEPEPPEGSPDSLQVFRAGRNFYRWCVFVWACGVVAILCLLTVIHFSLLHISPTWPKRAVLLWRIVELLVITAFAAGAAFSYFAQRLNYRLRWYMITDRSLRIRRGVVSLQELTMTFSNIQEIRLSAGPIQNALKIADVEVHSAGGGSDAKGGGGGHVGRFEGVSNANAIRDLLVERLRRYRDSGLGEVHHEDTAKSGDAVEAARTVLTEAQALRRAIQSKF